MDAKLQTYIAEDAAFAAFMTALYGEGWRTETSEEVQIEHATRCSHPEYNRPYVVDAFVVEYSPSADSRTADVATVSKDTLLRSSVMHIEDVGDALGYFGEQLMLAARAHDTDKVTDIDSFYADFAKKFETTEWWDRHRLLNRHHISQNDGIPINITLIDVLDYIADCVCAGMARSGSVYELKLPPALLELAFQNTVAQLKASVTVVGAPVKDREA